MCWSRRRQAMAKRPPMYLSASVHNRLSITASLPALAGLEPLPRRDRIGHVAVGKHPVGNLTGRER